MITPYHIAALVIALVYSSPTRAVDKYSFLYTFQDTHEITGTFFGNTNGNLITDIHNISSSYAGFTDRAYLILDNNGMPNAILSIDGSSNNIQFYGNYNAFFAREFVWNFHNSPGPQIFSMDKIIVLENWHVSLSASNVDEINWIQQPPPYIQLSIPEPETYALMLAGFGALGLAVRRRKSL